MWLSFVTGVFLCCSLTAGLVDAQGVGASGGLRGVVTDPTGASLPKVAVTATDTQRGTKLSAITDTSGEYRLSGLTPERSGFPFACLTFVTIFKRAAFKSAVDSSMCNLRLLWAKEY